MIPGEFDLIRRYFKPLASGFPGALGLGDDAALLGLGPDEELVVTTDMVVEGVHFLSDDPPGDIAAKLLRVNLSDLAAMGATPVAYTLNAAFPTWVDEAWLAAFAEGLAADLKTYGFPVAGGDTVSTPGPLTLGVCAFGRVEKGRALRRSAARSGDAIYVTGTIGDAALGLAVRKGRWPGDAAGFLIERYRRPRPRTGVGPRLVGTVLAAIDISDGLVADLGHVCEESAVSAVIEAGRVPLSDAARTIVADDPAAMELVLGGGDDYELLFTAANDAAKAIAEIAAEAGVPITRIGSVGEASDAGAVSVIGADGTPMSLGGGGFRHF